MLGHRDALAVTGLAPVRRRRGAYKTQLPRIREQQNSVLQFYFIKNQILIAFCYYYYITIYPKDLSVLTIIEDLKCL